MIAMEGTEEQSLDHPAANHGRRKIITHLWRLLAVILCLEFLWATGTLLTARRKNREQAAGTRNMISAGTVDDIAPGEVRAVPAGKFYLVCLEDGGLMALSKTCTHLGCSVPWNREQHKFICPCHGSTFDQRGVVLSPPAIRPLDTYPVRVENGRILVDASHPKKRESFQTSQVAYR
jgi:cytochrome b6-f complex iron-sulfur subunit